MIEATALGIPTICAQAPVLAMCRPTRKIRVGSLNVGGDAPIIMQSMATTKTHGVGAALQQIAELTVVGCDIVRVTCPADKNAEALPIITKQSRILVIADTHFNPKYVPAAIEAGCGATRINPGNICKFNDQVANICKAASDASASLRIGVNAGSLDKCLPKKYGKATPGALVGSATWKAGFFGKSNSHNFEVSVKHHDVVTMVQTYRLLSGAGQWPLRLGVAEAGPAFQNTIKSCAAFGTLLAEGIDGTIRVSLSAPPVEEVKMGTKPLEFIELREHQFGVASCPSCGRAQVDAWTLAEKVETGLKKAAVPLCVAVMSCVVNGPGEAREADLGCASGNSKDQIFVRGQAVETISEDQAVETLLRHAEVMAAKMAEEPGEEISADTSPVVSVTG